MNFLAGLLRFTLKRFHCIYILPLVITSDVSPVGNHSVRIVANNVSTEDTVSYIISDTAEPTSSCIFHVPCVLVALYIGCS